jgi:hypothetical protein
MQVWGLGGQLVFNWCGDKTLVPLHAETAEMGK